MIQPHEPPIEEPPIEEPPAQEIADKKDESDEDYVEGSSPVQPSAAHDKPSEDQKPELDNQSHKSESESSSSGEEADEDDLLDI